MLTICVTVTFQSEILISNVSIFFMSTLFYWSWQVNTWPLDELLVVQLWRKKKLSIYRSVVKKFNFFFSQRMLLYWFKALVMRSVQSMHAFVLEMESSPVANWTEPIQTRWRVTSGAAGHASKQTWSADVANYSSLRLGHQMNVFVVQRPYRYY